MSIICFCMGLSLVSADKTDCGIFGIMHYSNTNGGDNGFDIVNSVRGTDSTNRYSSFLSAEQKSAIMDKESLNTAMLNLKKYCCENKLGGIESKTCEDDKSFFNDNIIDSPYLFDHLFDVEMRRLSGLTGEFDIYTKTDMSGDSKGLEWRTRINDQAQNASGANPQIIINKYKEFWQPSSPQLGYDISQKVKTAFGDYSDETFLSYVSGQGGTGDSTQVAEAFKNYDSWTLYDRYNNACAVTQYFYALLDLSGPSDDKNKNISNLAQGMCDNVVVNQINNENSYVQLVILQAGNLFLQNYMEGYLSYLYDRTQALQKTWSDITDRFLDVVRGVPHLVHTCVK